MKFVNKNYYEILDIDPKASEDDIKRAYRLVRSTWTPDSIAIYSLYTPDESEAISHKIEEAYQILSHPERRASYDRYIHHVDRLPPASSGPQELWDYLHGLEPESDENELLDDVTDLLADPALEAEELSEEVVLEATGGDARGIERLMADERSGFDEGEAIPDLPGDRARSQGRGPALAAAGTPSRTTAFTRATPAAPRSPATRESKADFPAAPAAPPVKGAPPAWSPTPTPSAPSRAREVDSGSSRQTGNQPASVRPGGTGTQPPNLWPAASNQPASLRPGGSGTQPTNLRPTAAPTRPGPQKSGVPEPPPRPQFNSSPPDPRQPVSVGWSRNYATAFKPSRPLPDRPISPQMLADCEAEHGLGGTYLRMIREYKGITIDDIAERTKIQHAYLKCVEDENYGDLPAAVYIEGFVTQMARLLKIDVPRVVDGYMARYQERSSRRTDPDDL